MLREIFGEEPFARFLKESYLKIPLSVPDAAKPFATVLDWEDFYELVPKIPGQDVLVVKNGKLSADIIPRTSHEAKELQQTGFSIVLRHTEQFASRLAQLAHDVQQELQGEVVIQLYATPAGYHSFGWHYDAEEVFIIQASGRKDYFLRSNTINPHPRLETMPKDMQYEKETSPFAATNLIGGDFLYIPGGWWHMAKAIEDSLSISIGILPKLEQCKAG